MKGTFHPGLKVVFDKQLGTHVLQIGEWRDNFGRVVAVEILSMARTRKPGEVRDISGGRLQPALPLGER